MTFLLRSQELGKKWITTVLVRISSFSPWIEPALAGANWTSYSFFWLAYFGFGAELLDHGEVHHLIERRLLGDRADLLVEEVRGVPGALEVRRVVLVQEEVAVLGVVGRVRVAEHAERVALGNRVAGRHQLGDLLLGVLRLQVLHRVEDAADEPFHDVGVVLGEVGAREPDVGDQLVGGRGRDHQPVALDLLEVVDVGRPADDAGQASCRR